MGNQLKPIIMNIEEVKAVLDGRKTVTRRVIKRQPYSECGHGGDHEFVPDDFGGKYKYTGFVCRKCGYGVSPPHGKYPCGSSFIKPPYNSGDILYVRETWSVYNDCYIYKVYDRNKKILEDVGNVQISWRPSIHMPKEAARIFLRVTDVGVERLQDIDDEEAKAVGAQAFWVGDLSNTYPGGYVDDFIKIWDSAVKKSDLDKYGWNADPWVWRIEFERSNSDV